MKKICSIYKVIIFFISITLLSCASKNILAIDSNLQTEIDKKVKAASNIALLITDNNLVRTYIRWQINTYNGKPSSFERFVQRLL